MSEATDKGLYGMLAEFETPEQLVAATRLARSAGYRDMDTFSPHPVEGLEEALDHHDNTVAWMMFLAGIGGASLALFLQTYTSVWHYPYNIGGRPLFSWPAFIPVTFELTVLSASLVGVISMLVLNRLPMPHHPLFNLPRFALASDNRFFLCIFAEDGKFDVKETREFLAGLHPAEVTDVER